MDNLHQLHSDVSPDISPALDAGLILAASALLRRHSLPCPSVDEVLAATGSGRTRAYECMKAVVDLLPSLHRPTGRPKNPEKPPPASSPTEALTRQVLAFLFEYPGAVSGGPVRKRYSDRFRSFILEMCQEHRLLPLDDFASAVQIPLRTLKDWLRGGHKDSDKHTELDTSASSDEILSARVQTVIHQWRQWDGPFTAFLDHINFDLRIPMGKSLIASILEQHGERQPKRRSGRSPDEKALRNAFETFFPGAQWEGDGTPLVVEVAGETFRFNLELMVDSHSSALVGVSVRDEEDSQAVVQAAEDGVKATGEPPLALLLDNRPSNQTDEVKDGVAPATVMHATKGRGQNKAHVEGAFGLFAQIVPPLLISASSPKDIAREVLQIVVQTWARVLNHKPREERNGRSRVDEHNAQPPPTPQQIEEAQRALDERIKKQQKARETLKARQDPVVRSLLDEAFERLALLDPTGNIRAAIARYPLDHVVNGIAIFEGRLSAGTLPPDLDGGRYLLGIIRNVSQTDEGLKITEALLRTRLDAQDRLLQPLAQALDQLILLHTLPIACLKALTDRALDAERKLDRLFWLSALVDAINRQPSSQQQHLIDFISRRIYARFAIPYKDRQWAVRFIVTRVITVQ